MKIRLNSILVILVLIVLSHYFIADTSGTYLNGSEVTSFATDNRANYAQNTDYGINSNVKHNIGSNQAGGNFGDYYIADVNFSCDVNLCDITQYCKLIL